MATYDALFSKTSDYTIANFLGDYARTIMKYMKDNALIDASETRTEGSIVNFIDNSADLGFNGDILSIENHWNESFQDLIEYYKDNIKNLSDVSMFPWSMDDFRKADAGNSFVENNNYVIPWLNKDNESYVEVRNADKNSADLFLSAATSARHLHFTHE